MKKPSRLLLSFKKHLEDIYDVPDHPDDNLDTQKLFQSTALAPRITKRYHIGVCNLCIGNNKKGDIFIGTPCICTSFLI